MRSAVAILAFAALMPHSGAVAQFRLIPAATSKDKLVCKSFAETGSLVRFRKHCFTQKDWDRITDSQQRGARRMVEELTTR